MRLQDVEDRLAPEVREAMYSLADRYQLLSPSSFAATQMLGNLGQGIVPSLLSREVGPVRASLNFLLHALAPLTATEDVKKVQVLGLRHVCNRPITSAVRSIPTSDCVCASLTLLLHALAPLTTTEDVEKVLIFVLHCSAIPSLVLAIDFAHARQPVLCRSALRETAGL